GERALERVGELTDEDPIAAQRGQLVSGRRSSDAGRRAEARHDLASTDVPDLDLLVHDEREEAGCGPGQLVDVSVEMQELLGDDLRRKGGQPEGVRATPTEAPHGHAVRRPGRARGESQPIGAPAGSLSVSELEELRAFEELEL